MRRYRSLVRTGAPTESLLTLDEARLHVRVEEDEGELTYLGALIAAATNYVEERRDEAMLDQEWTMELDRFPWSEGCIRLPRPPLLSVTSISYRDSQGSTQTLASSAYRVLTGPRPGEIHPVYGTSWPSVYTDPGAVTITFRAGYGTEASDVPQTLRQAAKILVATWFEQREAVVTGTIVSQVPRSAEALIDLTRTEW